ncbi:hypothetical protein, partial [Sulfuricurvum sp.]|uniref:hypothetical protein n=1 Tax=Sulfuricurvum sp. TaxID=2025608 RepID=UPI0025D1876C
HSPLSSPDDFAFRNGSRSDSGTVIVKKEFFCYNSPPIIRPRTDIKLYRPTYNAVDHKANL